MKCPWCGKDVPRKEGETAEEFRERWEAENCDDECKEKMLAESRSVVGR